MVVTLTTASDLWGTAASPNPSRASLFPVGTFSCNGTFSTGFLHTCVAPSPCIVPEITGQVTTAAIEGHYVINCNLSGSLTATPGIVSGGISTGPGPVIRPTPLQTTSGSVIVSTMTVTSSTDSTLTATASPTATANIAARHSNTLLSIATILWIGIFLVAQ